MRLLTSASIDTRSNDPIRRSCQLDDWVKLVPILRPGGNCRVMYEYLLTHLKTVTPGIQLPTPVSPEAAMLLSMQYQFEHSQYMSPEWIEQQQMRKAGLLLRYAHENVPYYRKHIPAALAKTFMTLERWQSIPVLTREDLQRSGKEILSQRIPSGHKPLRKITTSGSTGMPVTAYGTQVTRQLWQAITFRYQIWQQMDFRLKLAAIRPDGKSPPGQASTSSHWGPPASHVVETGPGVRLNIRTPLEQQIEWLRGENPGYLHTMPTNLRQIAKSGVKLSGLRGLSTYGELLDDTTRSLCDSQWNLKVFDVYSTQEVGNIAIQCPEAGAYHVQAESVLVEILDEQGRACTPGQPGRVVITPLHNLAFPLIRYAIGDYATLGPECACGRGLPVLRRIFGRRRNMLVMPNGDQYWPSFPVNSWAEDLPIRQFQFVQKSIDLIEARLVVHQELSAQQESHMKERLQERFGYPVEISIIYQDTIERSKSGKYEDFVSEVPD